MLLYKQVGLFLIWMQSKNERHGFADPAQPTSRKPRDDQDRVRERKRKLTAHIENIVIAGAGQAGGRAAEALRARGFRGAITILGEEPHPPYERPQLSKAMLHSPGAPVAYIKQARDWSDATRVELVLGVDADRDHSAPGCRHLQLLEACAQRVRDQGERVDQVAEARSGVADVARSGAFLGGDETAAFDAFFITRLAQQDGLPPRGLVTLQAVVEAPLPSGVLATKEPRGVVLGE